MRDLRYFEENSYYHLINRGNNQDIFLVSKDYRRFIQTLAVYSKKFNIKILAFALMPNHVHLLVQQKSEIPLSKFMQVLFTSYAGYFNLKYKRHGHLLQNRFKAILVAEDSYLVHVSRYIHLNPSSASLVKQPEAYPFSSYRHYLGIDNLAFIDKSEVLGYFSSNNPAKDYQEFVTTRVNYQKEISLQKLLQE